MTEQWSKEEWLSTLSRGITEHYSKNDSVYSSKMTEKKNLENMW
jgi:hypothetical protein